MDSYRKLGLSARDVLIGDSTYVVANGGSNGRSRPLAIDGHDLTWKSTIWVGLNPVDVPIVRDKACACKRDPKSCSEDEGEHFAMDYKMVNG